MATFSKILSKTDIHRRLLLPAKYLKSLPSFKGCYSVGFQAIDEKGKIWTFKCSIRKKGHPKPVVTQGWLPFVRSKKLKVGYKIKFYKKKSKGNATNVFRVRAEKQIKIFGATLGYLPI